MSSNLKVGHPFYFPTQVILLDDDPDFLEGVSLMLDKNISYKLFQSANLALDYVNQAHQQVELLSRCYSIYKTGPLESDSLSHVDISKLHLEVLNGSRFQTTSTVIVDYSMPEMNGLEFLTLIKNPFIKKVLLTGQADTELALKAFNKQLIDQFIDKHDPKLRQKLNATISSFQDQYFRNSYKLITDPIIANNHDAFLVDAGFQVFFEELREKLNCVEYYMIESPHSGFLMIDALGQRRCLLVFSEEAVLAHLQALIEINAPAELIAQIKNNEILPDFDVSSDEANSHLSLSHPGIKNWQQHYYPAIKVNAKQSFFATLVSDEALSEIHNKEIIPYADYIQANSIISEIMH